MARSVLMLPMTAIDGLSCFISDTPGYWTAA